MRGSPFFVHKNNLFTYYEHMKSVNKPEWTEQIEERLKDYGLSTLDSKQHAGTLLPLQREYREATKNRVNGFRFLLDTEGHLRKNNSIGESNYLLCLPYVSRPMHEWLRTRKLNFIDASGNAWIDIPGTKIWVEGRPRFVPSYSTVGKSRAFKATGLKVIFVLLVWEELLSSTVREIADVADVSIGAVSNTLKDLVQEGYLSVEGRQRRFRNTRQLQHRWIEHYITELIPKLKSRRVQGPTPKEWREAIEDENLSRYSMSGENALALHGLGIAPESTLLYGHYPWREVTMKFRLIPDEHGNTLLREQFWNSPLGYNKTPKLLIYADILATQDSRQIEIAEKLRVEFEEF